MRRIIGIVTSLILVFSLTACGKNQPVDKVEKVTNNYVLEHYVNNFSDFSDVEAEIYYISWEGGLFTSVGPTEPGYRAVVFLINEVEDLYRDYEWELVKNPQFTLELIDIPDSQEWYKCKQLEEDMFNSVSVNYLYYNGTDTLVFDIHTY